MPAKPPASTHRLSPIRKARRRENRSWLDWRPESKTSNQWVKPFQSSHVSQNRFDLDLLKHFFSYFAFLKFSRQLYFLETYFIPCVSSLAFLQVMEETEQYLQQLLMRAVAVLPQWRVRVQKCKAIQMVLNLCSPSVTEKCLIAEAWCPVNQLPALQSALREGGVRI